MKHLISILSVIIFLSCGNHEEKQNQSQQLYKDSFKDLYEYTGQYFSDCITLLEKTKVGDTIAWITYYKTYYPMLDAYKDNLAICRADFNRVATFNIKSQTIEYYYERKPECIDTLISDYKKCSYAIEEVKSHFLYNDSIEQSNAKK